LAALSVWARLLAGPFQSGLVRMEVVEV
jgi:hypothetical protein